MIKTSATVLSLNAQPSRFGVKAVATVSFSRGRLLFVLSRSEVESVWRLCPVGEERPGCDRQLVAALHFDNETAVLRSLRIIDRGAGTPRLLACD